LQDYPSTCRLELELGGYNSQRRVEFLSSSTFHVCCWFLLPYVWILQSICPKRVGCFGSSTIFRWERW
jgi:hypothetical protein